MNFKVYINNNVINTGCFNNAEELLNGILYRHSSIVRDIEKKRIQRKYGHLTADTIVDHYKHSIRIEIE